MKKNRIIIIGLVSALVVFGAGIAYKNLKKPTIQPTIATQETTKQETNSQPTTQNKDDVKTGTTTTEKPVEKELSIDKVADEIQQPMKELPIIMPTSKILGDSSIWTPKSDGKVAYLITNIGEKTVSVKVKNTTDESVTVSGIHIEEKSYIKPINDTITLNPKEEKNVDIIFSTKIPNICSLYFYKDGNVGGGSKVDINKTVKNETITDASPLIKSTENRTSASSKYFTVFKNEVVGNGIIKGKVTNVTALKSIDKKLDTIISFVGNEMYLGKVTLEIANTTSSDIVLNEENIAMSTFSSSANKRILQVPYKSIKQLNFEPIILKPGEIKTIILPTFLSNETSSSIIFTVGEGLGFLTLESMEQ